ncbi:PE domain-containing protein [Mycobacterium haemophilum]|uniref:PE domain-containing protein n=1 Tax=Mycobacterium haemophilum TaxID=29311 RepID=UPI0009E35ACA
MSLLTDVQEIRANPGGMTEVSAKMVEIAHQISIANAKKASVMTKIPAPGKDSVSALSTRFLMLAESCTRCIPIEARTSASGSPGA